MIYFDTFSPMPLVNEYVLKNFPKEQFSDSNNFTTVVDINLSYQDRLLPLLVVGIPTIDVNKFMVVGKLQTKLKNSILASVEYFLIKELTEDENVFPYFITVAHVLNDRVSYTSVHVDKEQPIEVQEEIVAQIMTIMNVIEQHYESNE